MPVTIRRALISVSDKSGVVEFAKALADRGVEILSTAQASWRSQASFAQAHSKARVRCCRVSASAHTAVAASTKA